MRNETSESIRQQLPTLNYYGTSSQPVFDEFYLEEFITKAKTRNTACQLIFSGGFPAFKEHALPLSSFYTPAGGLYLADLWYFREGTHKRERGTNNH